jgi:hypothetical protein
MGLTKIGEVGGAADLVALAGGLGIAALKPLLQKFTEARQSEENRRIAQQLAELLKLSTLIQSLPSAIEQELHKDRSEGQKELSEVRRVAGDIQGQASHVRRVGEQLKTLDTTTTTLFLLVYVIIVCL